MPLLYQAKLQSIGTRPTPETLSILRKLKYAESSMFGDRDPYSASPLETPQQPDAPSHADIEAILLDLM